MKERVGKLRISRRIIQDKLGASVFLEQHFSTELDVISSFAVFHGEKDVRPQVKKLVKDARPRIGLRIDWEGRDVIDILIRKERAPAHEKLKCRTS